MAILFTRLYNAFYKQYTKINLILHKTVWGFVKSGSVYGTALHMWCRLPHGLTGSKCPPSQSHPVTWSSRTGPAVLEKGGWNVPALWPLSWGLWQHESDRDELGSTWLGQPLPLACSVKPFDSWPSPWAESTRYSVVPWLRQPRATSENSEVTGASTSLFQCNKESCAQGEDILVCNGKDF